MLLDLAMTHEIGTSAKIISHDVVQSREAESEKIAASCVESVVAQMNWVSSPINKIYEAVASEAVASNVCVTPEAPRADAVLLNQCLAETAAMSTEKGTNDFLFSRAAFVDCC